MDTTYRVSGMTCGGCVRSVTRAVEAALASVEVEVSLEQGSVRIRGHHDPEAVKRAVEDAGFSFGGPAR